MQVFAFVDTNVLLHYVFFTDVDWAAQLGLDNVTLVFAPIVLSELDRHKWAGSRREKARAKAVLKKLDALGLSGAAVIVRPGVSAVAVDTEPADMVFTDHRLDREVSDDRLLASLLSFGGAASGDRVLVLTGDTGLRVKARARRLEVAVPNEALESPPEPDEVERELERTRRELAEAKGATPVLGLTFVDGGTHAHFEVKLVRAFNEEAFRRLLREWRSRHPHIGGMPDSIAIPGHGTITLPNLAGIPGFVSAAEAAARNAEIDNVCSKYETFLNEWPAAVNRAARVVPFKLILENAGTAPADDVDVQLSTDARGRWLTERPELPVPPEVATPRGLYDSIFDYRPRYYDTLPAGVIGHAAPNVDGPNISGEDPRRLHYGVRRVKHHIPSELPIAYFQFDSDADVGSFAVDVQIVAANIRKPVSTSLNVRVCLATPAAPPEPGREKWL